MDLKLVPNTDGSVDIMNSNLNILLRFAADGTASFPTGGNIYTKETASNLASLTLVSGGILEFGSNVNGEFIKFANGFAIVTKKIFNLGPITSAWGSGWYISGTIQGGDFALPFIDIPLDVRVSAYSPIGNLVTTGLSNAPTAAKFPNFQLMRGTSQSATDFTANLFAIGRWKA